MRWTTFLTLILAGLGWTGCRLSEPAGNGEPQLFADLYVRYLQEEGQLKAEASFLSGDSLPSAQPKTFLGGVAFQGSNMELRHLPDNQQRYQLTRQAAFSDTLRFRLRDEERGPLEWALSIQPVTDFLLRGQPSLSDGLTLVARGGQLQQNEELVLLFTDAERRARSITINGPSTTIEHELRPDQLQGINPGPVELYLVKKRREQRIENGVHTTALIEYYTRTVQVDLQP